MKNTNLNWGYGAYAMNSEALGIGTVYYGAKYFDVDENGIKIFNPNTGAVYTAEEIRAINENAGENAEGYVMNMPQNAILGISANGSDKIFWYDEENARKILSHTDALALNSETGVLSTAEGGEFAAEPIK